MDTAYQLYGLRPSFYTRKVAGMLQAMDLPHEDLLKTADIAAEVEAAVDGYRKFPVLRTPVGDWVKDSTEIGLYLNDAHPEAAILPADPVMRVLALMLDDWIDEWLLRPTLYWRVTDRENRRWVARQAVASMNGEWDAGEDYGPETDHPGVSMAMQFFAGAGEVNRVGEEHRDEILGILTRAADAMTAHFQVRPFFLGERPSLPDFALYGMLEAGLLWEPAARSVVERSWPSLVDFRDRMKSARAGQGAYDSARSVPPSLGRILEVAGSDYGDFLMANAAALASGKQEACWGDVSMRARGFTEKCRQQTSTAIGDLNEEELAELQQVPGTDRLLAAYWAGGL